MASCALCVMALNESIGAFILSQLVGSAARMHELLKYTCRELWLELTIDKHALARRALGYAYLQPLITLTSVKSSSPHFPPSRPLPDCLYPPNGLPEPSDEPLICTMPARSFRPRRLARSTDPVWT